MKSASGDLPCIIDTFADLYNQPLDSLVQIARAIGQPIPIVIHHHGGGGFVIKGSADWIDGRDRPEWHKVEYIKAVMESGKCAIASTHAGGDHWGNQHSVEANVELYETLMGSKYFDSKRVGMMSAGLGSLSLLNSILGPLREQIKVIAILQGVSSLENTISSHTDKTHCLKAYQINGDMLDDEAVAKIRAFDPLPKVCQLLPNVPFPKTIISHGIIDDHCPPAKQVYPLAEALARARVDVQLMLFPVGHELYSVGKPLEECLRTFFSSSL